MPLNRFLFCLFFIAFSLRAHAQQPANPDGLRQPRILILLDGSSSMVQPWGKSSQRFTAAAKVITSLMDSIYQVNGSVEFGLRVYGHQSSVDQHDCYDSQLEVPFSKDNRTQMMLRLASIKPVGVSPIAYSLKQAAMKDLVNDARNAYSIILITDGGESCGGDICDVVKTLVAQKIFFKPYILSMVDYKPLEEQYACLGKYLQVAQESDMAPAISTIVDAYRPLLTSPILVTAPPPIAKPVVDFHDPVVVLKPTPKPVEPAPQPVNADKLSRLQYRSIPYTAVRFGTRPPRRVANPQLLKLPGRFNAYTIPKVDSTPKVAVVPPVKKDTVVTPPPVKKPAVTTVTMTKPPTGTNAPPAQTKEVEDTYLRKTEDAQETTLSIFFTDGHGKFYETSPQLLLSDSKSGKLVKDFARNVTTSGEPVPLPIAAGTYDLTVPGTKVRTLYRGIPVEDKKKNIVIVKVRPGSLKFVYGGAPNRPVKEFEAIVKRNFEPGPNFKQPCTEEREYEPGNYHIEIHTLPMTIRMVDIDFNDEKVITIAEPGTVQIANDNPMGTIPFFYNLGGRYMHFVDMTINGKPDMQKLQLQPGLYEVHWRKTGGKEGVQPFEVKSNSITQITLEE